MLLEIKDEILDGEPRYRIRNNSGDILYDHVNIEQITPAIQEPTPQNSDFYNKLMRNFSQFYLSSQYRLPNMNNETPKTYTSPSLTSSNPQGYVVTTSNIPATDGGVANGIVREISDFYTFFGGDGASYVAGQRTSGSGTHVNIFLTCPLYIKLTSVSVNFSGSFTVYGSNDNTNWVQLASSTSSPMTITNKNYYKYFKFYWHKNTSSSAQYLYNNITFTGQSLTTLEQNKMIINSEKINEKELISYEEGLILKIKTPSNYIESTVLASSINLYGLGEKNVPTDLKANHNYSLMYNGTKFVHENSEIINAIVALGGSV